MKLTKCAVNARVVRMYTDVTSNMKECMQAKVTIFIFGLLQLVTSAEVCRTPGALHVSLDTKSVNSFCYAYVFFFVAFVVYFCYHLSLYI